MNNLTITKIIQENREELYEALKACDDRIISRKRSSIYNQLDKLSDGVWISVKDRLPEFDLVVGVKQFSGFKASDKLVLKPFYRASGKSEKQASWNSSTNREIEYWCVLPEIEEFMNPITAILEAHDISQSEKTTFEEAAPFHYVYEDENGDDEIDDDMSMPTMVIQAINDARENMDYSNWHASKFDAAVRVIERYCKEHNIPMDYRLKAPNNRMEKPNE